ncbi:MAG: hypothetical protein U9O89_00530, partial [Thermoproteota archaeon]|nr:hypothetical protein [Thermoproteota archaeon]
MILNAFTWYYVGYMVLGEILDNLGIVYWKEVTVWIIHFLIVAASALLGGIVSNRVVQRATLMVWWMVLGIASSLLLLTLGGLTWIGSMLISTILAFSFGVGMPSCLAYFADFTSVENRGRLGGCFFCATYLGISFFALILPQFNLATKVLFSSLWRLFGLFVFLKTRTELEVKYVGQAKEVSYSYIRILEQKPILLYLIPWAMFSIINNLEIPILENFFGSDLSRSMGVVELACSSLFVLVGGFFADLVGRKRVTVAGFVALGIAYAILGFFPDMLIFQWFYSIVGAVAWGMFTTV